MPAGSACIPSWSQVAITEQKVAILPVRESLGGEPEIGTIAKGAPADLRMSKARNFRDHFIVCIQEAIAIAIGECHDPVMPIIPLTTAQLI